MNFLKKLFSKSPDTLLANGDRLVGQERYYEARCTFEEALEQLSRSGAGETGGVTRSDLLERIAAANRSLARVNITEAGICSDRGDHEKAGEHLELAISLTDDEGIRQEAEKLLAKEGKIVNDKAPLAQESSCSSCSSCGDGGHGHHHDVEPEATNDMPPMQYYDLLIHQLPPDVSERYGSLGEQFALLYIAESESRHEEALELLEKWYDGSHRDIYCYEKGMILFRTGRIREAEVWLRGAVSVDPTNSLANLGLALYLIETGRLGEAGQQLDGMLAKEMLKTQSLMLRASVHAHSGEFDAAIRIYGDLLNTPAAKQAAEPLCEILHHCGRDAEAAHVHKKYLSGCSSH